MGYINMAGIPIFKDAQTIMNELREIKNAKRSRKKRKQREAQEG